MDKRTNRCIKAFIASMAAQNPDFIKAYLFGSYAKGNQKTDSDIDLALIFNHLDDKDKFDLQVQLQASEFDLRIEPHPISREDFNSNNPFAAEIKRTGIEIKPQAANRML